MSSFACALCGSSRSCFFAAEPSSIPHLHRCPAAPTLAGPDDSAHASRRPFAADNHLQMHICAWQLRHSVKLQRHASPVERTPNPISPTATAPAMIPTKSHQRSFGASHSGMTAPSSQTMPRQPTPSQYHRGGGNDPDPDPDPEEESSEEPRCGFERDAFITELDSTEAIAWTVAATTITAKTGPTCSRHPARHQHHAVVCCSNRHRPAHAPAYSTAAAVRFFPGHDFAR